jgi:hypothetical protein
MTDPGFPPDDEVPAHRYGPPPVDVRFAVSTGYGVGEPHHFVALDELALAGAPAASWWLTAESATRLGQSLLDAAASCHRHA